MKTIKKTTIQTDEQSLLKLNSFCRKNKITKGKFVEIALNYFIQNGVNPAEDFYPAVELAKLAKRMDQFFGFLKKQEQDLIKPLQSEIIENNNNVILNFEKILNNQKYIYENTEKLLVK